MAWDVTIPDTFANSYIGETLTRATAAADRAAENKMTKYTDLTKTHHFVPIAIETGGVWNELDSQWHTDSALELVRLTHVRAAKQ